MRRISMVDPHLQCLHDFLGRSVAGWSLEAVYTLSLFLRKPLLQSGDTAVHRAFELVFEGFVWDEGFLFIASLHREILDEIYASSGLQQGKAESSKVMPNYGWVDPDRSTVIILSGFSHKRAFEDPGKYSPKRVPLLRTEEFSGLISENPYCFLLALGQERPYKPPPM